MPTTAYKTASVSGDAGFVCLALESGENLWLDVALDREVVRRGLQALPYGEHVDAVRAQIAHHPQDLIVVLAEPDHQPRLGRHRRVTLLERLQKLKRLRVVASRSGFAVEPGHGLQVVVQHVGRGGKGGPD